MPRYPLANLEGNQYGRLTVIERHHMDKQDKSGTHWLCKCDCGEMTVVRADNLRRGLTRSCGCLKKEHMKTVRGDATTHGMSGTNLYRRWVRIKQGCINPYHRNYRFYGAKGISICKRWYKFENFLADIKEVPPGFALRRKDKKGNWEPANVQIVQPGAEIEVEEGDHHTPRPYGL